MRDNTLSPQATLTRIDGIDILRGLSIFFVLMNHVHMRLFFSKIPYNADLPAQLVSSLVWNGQRGVQIFFCISGFLIASTSIRRWGSLAQIKASSFYWLRVARIAPLFAALLILLSLFHFAGIKNFVIAEKTGGLAGALLAALTFRINVLEANLGYLPASWDVLWSLSVEEMFYLMFPIICILCRRSNFLYVVLGSFIVLGPLGRTVLANGNEVWAEYSYLGSMDAISFGILAAVLSSRLRFSASVLKLFAFSGSLILFLALCFTRTTKQIGLAELGLDMSVLSTGTCLLLLAASQSQWRAPALFRPLIKMGERSYEIYLTHMFVVFAFFYLFQQLGSAIQLLPLLFIATIIGSTILGDVVGRFYSEPLNSFLRRQTKRKMHSATP